MDNAISVTLKNLKVGTEATIEELNINISFKCEPEVATKWMELIATAISKISA